LDKNKAITSPLCYACVQGSLLEFSTATMGNGLQLYNPPKLSQIETNREKEWQKAQ